MKLAILLQRLELLFQGNYVFRNHKKADTNKFSLYIPPFIQINDELLSVLTVFTKSGDVQQTLLSLTEVWAFTEVED